MLLPVPLVTTHLVTHSQSAARKGGARLWSSGFDTAGQHQALVEGLTSNTACCLGMETQQRMAGLSAICEFGTARLSPLQPMSPLTGRTAAS